MEVMTSIVICALLALMPHVLGKQSFKTSAERDLKFNTSLMLRQKPFPPHKLLLSLNAPPLVAPVKVSDLQSVFTDPSCKECRYCMEKAIKSHKFHNHIKNRHPSADVLHEVLTNSIHKYKRSADNIENLSLIPERKKSEPEIPVSEVNNLLKREKRTKTKKNKIHKSVTVTKFNSDGDVYALKVKESDALNDTQLTCTVYSVKKSFACDSPDVESLIKHSKKNSKKNKKELKGKKPDKAKDEAQSYKKREIDNSQLPENVMSSIEEFY